MRFSDNPISRFRAYLVSKSWWSEGEETALLAKHKADVLRSFSRAEKLPKPKLGEMFNDVWVVGKDKSAPSVIVRVYCGRYHRLTPVRSSSAPSSAGC